MKTLTLKINGMHCVSCALSIDLDLEDLNGVENSTTNYARQQTEITYDPTVLSVTKIIETIQKTGYTVNE